MERSVKNAFLLAGLLFWSPLSGAQAAAGSSGGVTLKTAEGFLNVRFLSDSIVRVSVAKDPKFFAHKSLSVLKPAATPVPWTSKNNRTFLTLKTPRLTVSIDLAKGLVRFGDAQDNRLLSESTRSLEKAVVQGEKTFHVHQQWEEDPAESLYGLGQNQLGMMDLKGWDLDLWQHNTNVAVPFLVSSEGYGILWDNTSYTRFGDLREFIPIPTEYLLDRNGKPGGLTVEPMDRSQPASQAGVIDIDLHPKHGEPRPPSTRWEGFIQPPASGAYQFDARSNGGIKVWLDGKLIMEHWRQGWLADHDRAKVSLEAGKRYALKIEWNTEQGTAINFRWKTPAEGLATSLWSEVGDGVDYYFVYGPSLDQVLAGYRSLTGQAPLMPNWSFGLWQSRQRYEKAQESLDVVKGFRDRKIPFDNIVQDWMYWRKDDWGSHVFDPDRFPDPDGWLKQLHAMNTHVMISVWSKFYPGSRNFDGLRKAGCLYESNLKEGIKDWLGFPYTFYDAFNPKGRKLFWDQMNTQLFQKGIDAWWLDSTEPDLMPSPPDRDKVREHMNPTALGTASRVLNAYPLVNSEAVYQGQRKAAPDQRVFILTRSAFLGSQRTASSVWSGDITSDWSVFAKQIPAGLNFSLSGIPYWATDVGGYTMRNKFSDRKTKPEDEEEWRELNVRWFQFGTFCPLLRVHGEYRHREMWEFGGEDSPAFKTMLKFDRLRYRMFPYLYSIAWEVTEKGSTFLRPLVMDFPRDLDARGLTDEYMFGQAFLVAPVTQYKARDRKLYLPDGLWYDFWTGKTVPPGSQKASAPYDSMPVYVRAGSIIPFGPELQYIAEKPQDPTTFYVYAGADGDFTLYEDDGLTYGYEKGEHSEIPLHWDDKAKKLTIGPTRGAFRGMLKERTFQVVLVSRNKPAGFSFDPNPGLIFTYKGEQERAGLAGR